MQNFSQTETRKVRAFVTKIEDVVGGCSLATSDLDVALDVIPQGTIIGLDTTGTGLWHVMKSAVAYAAATNVATAYQVVKGTTLKAGDFFGLTVGGIAKTIQSVDRSNVAYDTVNVDATLGIVVNAGDLFLNSTAAGATAGALPVYSRYAATNNDVSNTLGDNLIVGAWVMCTLNANAPKYVAAVKALNKDIKYV